MRISTLFKLVRNLPLAIVAFTLVATMPSPAEEVTLSTIVTKQYASGTYVIGGLYLPEELFFAEQEDYIPLDYTIKPWTALRSGTVLVKWHHPGVHVWPRPVSGDAASGDLSFSIKLNDEPGILGTSTTFTNIARFLETDFFCSPIIDFFEVTRGTKYYIDLQYRAQNVVNCKVSLLNDPGKGSIIEIEYLDTLENLLPED